MRKFLFAILIVFGVILLGASFYASWALRDMIIHQADHCSALMLTIHNNSTIPIEPDEPFIGSMSPTAIALLAVSCILIGWQGLNSQKPKTD